MPVQHAVSQPAAQYCLTELHKNTSNKSTNAQVGHLAGLQLGSQSVQLALLILLLLQLLLIQLLQQRQQLSMQKTPHPCQWCVRTGKCSVMLGTQQCNAPHSSCRNQLASQTQHKDTPQAF